MNDILAGVRRRLGWTQQKMADELGIARETVADYEKGRRRSDGRPVTTPRAIELAVHALALGIDLSTGGVNRSDRSDDRARTTWEMKQWGLPLDELEKQARCAFPEVWEPYPYAQIIRPEFDDAERRAQVMEQARGLDATGEWRTLPVAQEEVRGWDLYVRVVVTPTVKDLFVFKALEVI